MNYGTSAIKPSCQQFKPKHELDWVAAAKPPYRPSWNLLTVGEGTMYRLFWKVKPKEINRA